MRQSVRISSKTASKALAVMCLLSAILTVMPAFAESSWKEAHHDQHDANRESAKAAESRAEARSSAYRGHGLSARLHAHHARHEQEKANKHAAEARAERHAARHGY
jgi:hypothetical protein